MLLSPNTIGLWAKHMQTPVYMTVRQVKIILGPEWSMKKTRNWLRREQCLVKRAGYWVVTLDRLREAFPEIYDVVLCGIMSDDELLDETLKSAQ